jgi:putative DNA primase/helicase
MRNRRKKDELTIMVHDYVHRRYVPIPINRGEKSPGIKQWPELRLRDEEVDDFFTHGENVGLLLGAPSHGLIDIDLDAAEATIAARAFLPPTNMLHGRKSKPSSHRWYKVSNPPAPLKFLDIDGSCLVELRSTSQQTLVPPSRHPSGETFRWEQYGAPAKVKAKLLVRRVKLVAACSLLARSWPQEGSRHDAALAVSGTLERAGWSQEKTAKFVTTTAHAAGDEEWEQRAADAISTTKRLAQNGTATGATRLREIVGDAVVARLRDWLELSDRDGISSEEHLTDVGNAHRFVTQNGRDVRFCHNWRKWIFWDGSRWRVDETGEIERRAKDTVRKLYGEASCETNDDLRKKLGTWARVSESRSRITAMIELAKSEPRIPVLPADLDADAWILNCSNGTIDLKTGELRQHRPGDLITKLVPVPYDAEAKCPNFRKFLHEIFAGNDRLIKFLQRAIGYSLTGSTQEQVIFIFYGHGANGKSTLLETIRAALGDYSRTADPTLLLTRKSDGVRNDVARLAGARFVSTAETEAGRHLAEVLVKQLTGGDKVTARYLYSEFFEFDAQFKLYLATNHKPVIHGTDNAIWRRIRLVPFEVTIPEEQQDRTLPQKLSKELTGILAWAVRGCLRWQKHGLGQPKEVSAATQEYREEMDVIGAFLKDRCIVKKEAKVRASDLYQAYKSWCEKNGERPLTQQKLGVALADRNFRRYRTGTARMWLGIYCSDSNDGGDTVLQ